MLALNWTVLLLPEAEVATGLYNCLNLVEKVFAVRLQCRHLSLTSPHRPLAIAFLLLALLRLVHHRSQSQITSDQWSQPIIDISITRGPAERAFLMSDGLVIAIADFRLSDR